MRLLSLVLVFFSFLASPAVAQQTACEPFQLVGFTTATFDGATGVLGFTQACQAEFTGSRFCTTEEVMDTVTVPGGLVGDAWVRPVFAPTGQPGLLDASGILVLTCEGWLNAESVGIAVTPTGGFLNNMPCSVARPVACCAPVATPEPSAMLLQGSGIAGLWVLAKVSGRVN